MKKLMYSLLICLATVFMLSFAASAESTVKITQTELSPFGVTVAWEDSDEPDGYEVSMLNEKTGAYEPKAKVNVRELSLELDKAGTYTLRVTGYFDNDGETVYTEPSECTVVVLPGQVSGLKQAAYAEKTVKLSWKKVDAAEKYEVFKYSSTKKKYVSVAKTASLTYTDKKVSGGKSYKYKVRAYFTVDGTVYAGAYSSVVNGYTIPAKVTSLKAASSTTSSIKLSWSKVTGATGYKVYKYNSTKKKWAAYKTVTKNALTVSSLKAKTNYKFYVQAYRKLNSKAYFGTKSATLTTGTSTATPAISKVAAASCSKAKVTFKAVSGASGYEAQFSLSKKFTTVLKGSAKKSPVTVSGLTNGKTYYVRVRTYRTVDKVKVYSAYSKVKSFKLAVVAVDILRTSKSTYDDCTIVLKANVYPSNVTVKWTTSDRKIATVKAYGKTACKLTARKTGKVTVTGTFTYNKKVYKDTCKVVITSAKDVKKYAGTDGVPNFGTLYGAKAIAGTSEVFADFEGANAFAYLRSDVDKSIDDECEIDNYFKLLEKNGYDDSMWILKLAGLDDLKDLGDSVKLKGFYTKGTNMVLFVEEKTSGAIAIAVMDIANFSE